MTDAGHDLNADGELADRVHDLIRQDATGDATHLLREILFDLHRGRRQIDRATAGRLATAATQLDLWNEAEQWARYALCGAESQLDTDDELQARSDLIAALMQQQRFADALQEVLPQERSVAGADPHVLFLLHLNEGNVLAKQHRHEDALVRYSAATGCAQHVAKEELAMLELNRGASLNSLGRNEEAIVAYRHSLQLGIGTLAAGVMVNVANALRDLGRFDEAEQQYRKALEAAGNDRRTQGAALSNRALLFIEQGRRDEAKVMLQDAAVLRGEAGDIAGQAITLKELTKVLAGDHEYEDAAALGHRALQLNRSVGLPDDEPLMRLVYALAAMVKHIGRNPDTAAGLLVDQLRKAGPGGWLTLVAGTEPEILRLAITHLNQGSGRSHEADRGRAVEDVWITELLSGILELGPDLGIAEHSRRMQARMSAIDTIARLVQLDDWLSEKRFYEAEQTVLESPVVWEGTFILESRAAQLQLDPIAVAAVRDLVMASRERGIDIAFAELPARYPNELLQRFVNVGSWEESLQIVQAHKFYFSSQEPVEKLIEDADKASPMARAHLQLHIEVLQRSREVGAERAFAEASKHHGGPPLGKISIAKIGSVSLDERTAERQETEAIKSAKLDVERAKQVGEPRIWHHMLLELGQAYLDDETGTRAENLRLAADAFSEGISLGPDMPDTRTIECLLGLGRVRLEMVRGDDDPQHLLDAMAAFERALSGTQARRSSRWIRIAAREVFDVATTLAIRQQPPHVRLQLARKRLWACEAAMDATDELMRTGDLHDRVAEQEQALWAYAGAVEELTNQDLSVSALAAAERGRARGFLAEIELLDQLPMDVPPEIAERERAARDRLREARRGPADDLDDPPLEFAERELVAVHDEMAEYSPEVARLRSAAPPGVDELIIFGRTLQPTAVTVSWYTTPTECFAFAVFGGTGEVRAERTGLDIPRLADSVELASRDIWRRPTRNDQPLSPLWQVLTDSLLPVAWRQRLAAANEIVLVPHGVLGDLPLHALPLDWLGGRSLLESAPVEYRPGLTLAHRLRDRRPMGELAVVLAHAGEPPDPASPSEFELEARSVAATVQPAHLLVGPVARVARLTELAPRAAILHIAAHGVFDAADPLGSVIELSDGTWTGTESLSPRHVLERLRLPGTVVVLSGCETGRHSAELTDESEGLVRAFLIAGASAVVASHWRVDSSSTRHLMDQFHVRLRATGDVAVSLREAALNLRAAKTTSHPYYWAPFVAVGV